MNTLPFRANYEIKDPKILFGRKEELQKLCDFAEGLHQIEVIGARRFGKTCLIKSFITLRKENVNRNSYPLYVDVSSDDIKGTLNIYRYLTSQLVAHLLNDGYIEEGLLTIDDFNIIPSKNWKKIFKQLGAVEDEIDQIGIFDEAIELFSRQLGQTILLIFDEYEKAVDSFDSIDGLRHIRKMTNESNSLSFWIAGASPWKKFILGCSQDVRGSGVFNGITFNVDVCPLRKDDFHNMWNYECSLIKDDTKRKHLESLWEKVFVSSGGVPCFAKEIGGFTLIDNTFPQYYRLRNHFVELEKNLTDNEIKCLQMLSVSPQEYTQSEKPESVVTLEQYGFISIDENNRYCIASRFFAEFIRSRVYEERTIKYKDDKSYDSIVKEIQNIIFAINEEWVKQENKYMFDATNSTPFYYRGMSNICDSREKFANFINSIYLLYWEGAKEDSKAGSKIPEKFQWTMFRKSMDRIRHVFGTGHEPAKLETRPNQVDKATALSEIIGSDIEPQTPEEWCHFQECLLNRFLQELNDIYNSISRQSISKKKDKDASSSSNKPKRQFLIEGQEYEGIIIEIGSSMKIKCEAYPYPLRIEGKREELYEDDIVIFTAQSRPNDKDSSKLFWFATNVRLKEN